MKATTPDGCDDHEGQPRHQRTHTPVFHFLRQASESGRTPKPRSKYLAAKGRARALASPQPNQPKERATEPYSPETHARTHAHTARPFLRTARKRDGNPLCSRATRTRYRYRSPRTQDRASVAQYRALDETRRTEPPPNAPGTKHHHHRTTRATVIRRIVKWSGERAPRRRQDRFMCKNQPGAPDGPRIVPRR